MTLVAAAGGGAFILFCLPLVILPAGQEGEAHYWKALELLFYYRFHKGGQEEPPLIPTAESQTEDSIKITMKSLPQLLSLAAQLLPLLSLIYSVAVHIFLSSFNERLLWRFHHWNPIISRALLCCTSYMMPIIISTPHAAAITTLIAMLSIRLIIQTRQIEINGPKPPVAAQHHNKEGSSLHDKVIFITGANSGIGLETARLLYHQYNATVILACRSRARAIEAIRSIDPTWVYSSYNSSSGASFGNRMHFIPMDLTSMQSIRNAVKVLLEMKIPLHVLINNAGVMMNERMETVDGLEMTMAANVSNIIMKELKQQRLNF
jgi:hypothetical protein